MQHMQHKCARQFAWPHVAGTAIQLQMLCNMNTATVIFTAFWMFLAFTETKSSKDCPPVPCFYILYPPSCRAVSFFLHGKDQVCQGCDMCVAETTNMDDKGCPNRGCNKMAIPKGCRRDIYYVYQGN